MKTLLHIGCGRRRHNGFVNTDKAEMDVSKPWPHGDGSVDGIVSMAVFQCLGWPDLMVAFRESHRVLKQGGVMRMGLTLLETGHPLEWFLYGDNINLFTYDLLKNVLVDRIGFSSIRLYGFGFSTMPELARADARRDKGSSYIEVTK